MNHVEQVNIRCLAVSRCADIYYLFHNAILLAVEAV